MEARSDAAPMHLSDKDMMHGRRQVIPAHAEATTTKGRGKKITTDEYSSLERVGLKEENGHRHSYYYSPFFLLIK